jgi:tetratricopeptide (TPR) repeat protein
MMRSGTISSLVLFLLAVGSTLALSYQSHTLFGDLKIDDSKITGLVPLSYTIELCNLAGQVLDRVIVPANGRYRFLSVHNGEYDLVVANGGNEVARIHLLLQEKMSTDIRRDLELEWRPDPVPQERKKSNPELSPEIYARTSENAAIFRKALKAGESKDYRASVQLLREIVARDPKDFEAWEELGTMFFKQGKLMEAEKPYHQALLLRPASVLALLNLGKLQLALKKNEGAVEILLRLVELSPQFPEGHYFLGEAFLQVKRGSRAVFHFNQAIQLDPNAMADAHLRIAALYSAAGRKDQAAAEYEMFLAKRPGYPDKKKLLKYIKANKK